MIEFQDVVKQYNTQTAIDDISFTIGEAEVCVLIGPSGCGKTTSLKLINRMLEPSSGAVLLNGRPVGSFNPEQLRRGIGYVIQSVGLLPHMNVAENVGIVPRLLKWERSRREKRTDELLDLIGLDPGLYRGKYPAQLSGGEAQRIGVARALAADPPVLLMDEPFGAVDPLNREILQLEFAVLQRKLRKTVVFVTHDLDEAIRLADTVVIMKDGRIVQQGQPADILAHPADNFVRQFVGADRALKRLACFQVADHMQSAETIPREQTAKRQQAPNGDGGQHPVLWVTNADHALVGMLEPDPDHHSAVAYRPYVELHADEVGVRPVASLREALSRILGQGLRAAPVISEEGMVLGEVRLSDIEELNQRGIAR